MREINLGRVTAYADAVNAGYTGTREEFAVDLANAATYAAEAGDSAAEAKASEDAAALSASTAAQAAVEAAGSVDAVHADAVAAQAAKTDAIAAKDTAVSKAGEAANSASAAGLSAAAASASETAAGAYANTASSSATSAIGSASAAAESASAAEDSATEAASALGDVTAAKTEALAAIQTKGEETLESIPEDYTTLRNDVSSLKSEISYETTNLLENVSFSNGTINITTGAIATSGSFSFCSEFIEIEQDSPLNVNVAEGYKCRVFPYTINDQSGYVQSDYQEVTGNNVISTPYRYYRFSYTTTSGTPQPTPTINPTALSITQAESLRDQVRKNSERIEEINELIIPESLINGLSFVNGSIAIDTGAVVTSSVFSVCAEFIKIDTEKTLYVNVTSGYICRLFPYDTNSVSGYVADDYMEISGNNSISEPHAYYRIAYRRTNGVQPTPDEYTTALSVYQNVIKSNTIEQITIAKSGGDFDTLVEGLEFATSNNVKNVFVDDGEWNIIDELGAAFFEQYSSSSIKGLPLTGGMHIVFSSRAKIVCNYTGNNTNVNSLFSVFTVYSGDFTLENCVIEAANIRYCVHDDRSESPYFYHHKYLNCKMTIDNRNNAAWTGVACIGGGFGANGYVEVVGCEFKSLRDPAGDALVSWHNSSAANAKSVIFIKDCYFNDTGTIRIAWYGTTTEITNAYISNNSLGASIIEAGQSGATVVNTKVTAWNNEIRAA